MEKEKQEKIRFGLIDKPEPKGIASVQAQSRCVYKYVLVCHVCSSYQQPDACLGNRSHTRSNQSGSSRQGTDGRASEVSYREEG